MTVRAGNLSQHQGLLQGQRRNARERPQVQEEKVNALGARHWLQASKEWAPAVLESGRAWSQANGEAAVTVGEVKLAPMPP